MRTLFALAFVMAAAGCAGAESVPTSAPISTSAAASAVPTATEAVRTASPAPTAPAPTATPSSALPPGVWTEVVSPAEGTADHVEHVAYGNAGFLALGYRYESGEGGSHFAEAYAWISTDGESWDEVAPPPLDTEANDLWVTQDGEYLVSGRTADESAQPVVLRSPDGVTWSAAEAGLPAGANVFQVERGAVGYLLLARPSEEGDLTLWLSADGLGWELVHEFTAETGSIDVEDIGAGDDGFVVLGWRIPEELDYQRFALASNDGREWAEEPLPFGTEPDDYTATAVLAPLGPDWVAVLALRDGTMQAWSAENASAWEPSADIAAVELTSVAQPILVNVDGTLYFSIGGDPMATGSGAWSSADGATWTAVDIGEGAVSDAAGGNGVVVLAGHGAVGDGGQDARIWATPSD